MILPPPRSTRTDTHVPDTTLFRSDFAEAGDDFGSVLAVADFNGDGIADIAASAPLESTDVVMFNTGIVIVMDLTSSPAVSRGWVRSDIASLGEIERSEAHTSELQSLMRTSYSVFCLNTQKLP